MHPKLLQLLEASWENRVLGNTFPPASPERVAGAEDFLASVAIRTLPDLKAHIHAGYAGDGEHQLPAEAVDHVVGKELYPKLFAFTAGLMLHLDTGRPDLVAGATTSIGIMYWGDQGMDRGDPAMLPAIRHVLYGSAGQASPSVLSRARTIGRIKENVNDFAQPEDAAIVLAEFYENVLGNEVKLVELSNKYWELETDDGLAEFWEKHATQIADITTVSAGLPSVSSSLYACLRRSNPSLPPLSEVYADQRIKELKERGNAYARILDELGDHEMDAGLTDKGIRVLNPLNQYHPQTVQRYCELLGITDTNTVIGIQEAFAGFHDSDQAREQHAHHLVNTLCGHMRGYVTDLKADLIRTGDSRFMTYVDATTPVIEISYINTIGDIAMGDESDAVKLL